MSLPSIFLPYLQIPYIFTTESSRCDRARCSEGPPLKNPAGQAEARGDSDGEFEMEGGRFVIPEEGNNNPKPKRKRGGKIDVVHSDDSDFEDLHGIAGAAAAMRISGAFQHIHFYVDFRIY